MSIWNKLIGFKKTEDKNNTIDSKTTSAPYRIPNYAVVDIEVGFNDHKIHDIGALKHNGSTFHKTSKKELFVFLNDIDYICGHNIIHHDAKYLFPNNNCRWILVDTLYISPLLFPERPYHRLVKDDKLLSEQMNNPVNDCKYNHENEKQNFSKRKAKKISFFFSKSRATTLLSFSFFPH